MKHKCSAVHSRKSNKSHGCALLICPTHISLCNIHPGHLPSPSPTMNPQILISVNLFSKSLIWSHHSLATQYGWCRPHCESALLLSFFSLSRLSFWFPFIFTFISFQADFPFSFTFIPLQAAFLFSFHFHFHLLAG